MKKLLIMPNILLLTIIIFTACNSKKQVENTARIYIPPSSCMQTICKPKNENDIDGWINAKMISLMSERYSIDAGKAFRNSECNGISNNPKNNSKHPDDALSVVFDIQKLKNLIYLMERAKCENGCDTSIELGIRYYYIKYPCDLGAERAKGDGLDGMLSDLRNKHSLVMVPVFKNKSNNEWYDYNLWASSKTVCFPRIDLAITNPKIVFRGIIPSPGDNHGGIGPPPEPGTFPTNF